MSTYLLQVPEGLKPHHCERPGGEYSNVPIRYIMTQISEEDIRKTSIRLPDGNKLLVTVYSDENAEMYLRMLRDHDNLATHNGSKQCILDANAILRGHTQLGKPRKQWSIQMLPRKLSLLCSIMIGRAHRKCVEKLQPQHSAFLGVC